MIELIFYKNELKVILITSMKKLKLKYHKITSKLIVFACINQKKKVLKKFQFQNKNKNNTFHQ